MASTYQIILVFALVFSAFSIILQYTIGNRHRVQAIQKEMKRIQDEIQKAAKDKDENKLKNMDGEQKRMMDLMMESMSYQFKPTLVILPVFILVLGGFGFNGFLIDWFRDFSIQLPIAMHLTGNELLGLNIFHQSTYGVRGFFILCTVFSGLLLQLLVVPLLEKHVFKSPA